MKSKIIATISIVIAYIFLHFWWFTNIPFIKVKYYEIVFGQPQTIHQSCAIVFTMITFMIVYPACTGLVIKWLWK